VKAERERDLYRRIAYPSLWQQVQQLPGRAIANLIPLSIGLMIGLKLGG
jgi:hypothetical protein